MRNREIIHDHAMFRTLLQAMSRPGTVHQIDGAPGQHEAMQMLLGCIVDNEVTVAAIGPRSEELGELVRSRTGSRMVPVEEADFVVVSAGTSDGRTLDIKRGTLEYPDKGATVLFLVDEISESGGEFALAGPGIKGSAAPEISGLYRNELLHLKETNSEFPLGLDAIFIDRNGSFTCIPRSTRIGVQ